jgi:hypothetical protein
MAAADAGRAAALDGGGIHRGDRCASQAHLVSNVGLLGLGRCGRPCAQGVHDRTTLNWVTGRQIKNWYLQRAALAGYDGV